MGLCFKKELTLSEVQLFPPSYSQQQPQPTRLQERLLSKLGRNSFPFHMEFPKFSPTSVTLFTGPKMGGGDAEPCGVEYFIRAQIVSTMDKDRSSTVNMVIRKIQFAPTKPGRQPSTIVRKDFALSPGELELEATLDKQLYHHGEEIQVSMSVRNNSSKTVKKIVVSVVQCIDVAMFSGGHHTVRVVKVETTEGCPVHPGSNLQKQMTLWPTAKTCLRYGVALDGRFRGDDTSLASSTLLADENNKDIFGLVISYSVKVKLMLGAIGGELTAELPFVLMHPKPDMRKMMKADTLDMTHTDLEDEDRDERKNSVVSNLIDIDTKQNGMEMGPLRRRHV